MKFTLLLAVIAFFTFISTDGSPLTKKEKMNDNDENSHEDVTGKLETKKEKFKSTKENNEKTIPEPLEEEGNQLYIMVPAGKHVQKPKPFNYRRTPKMPIKPRYVLKKQNYPMPYAYPMFQDHEEIMEPETGLEYVPNVMGKMTDDLPMYYFPSPRKGQFTNNVDEMKQLYKAPFIYQDKESWNPYLENPDYYN